MQLPFASLCLLYDLSLVSVDYARDVEIRNSSKSVAYRINYCQIYRLGRGRCEERTKTNNTRHTYSADNLSNRREPLILTNSVVSRWKAIQLWKGRKYLSNHQDLQDMNDVQCSKENTFGFKDNKTMLAALQLPGLDLSTRFIQKNMTGPSFFDQLDVPGGDYLYWYGKVGNHLRQDVEPNELFDDVRPPIHYDMDHNFYVHISGRTHPMWHKSQCQYDACQSVSSTDCACPNFLKAEAREATLEGGEVLYIPPYWWHHVQSITASVSLASWSSSGVTRSMSFLWSRRLSFESVEHPEAKRAWLIYFIERLYSRTYGRDAQKRMRMMMDVRWKPLRSLFEDGWVEVCRAEEITEENKKKIEEDVEYVTTKLEDCQGAGAIRDLELMDYIEVLASGIYSEYLQTCSQDVQILLGSHSLCRLDNFFHSSLLAHYTKSLPLVAPSMQADTNRALVDIHALYLCAGLHYPIDGLVLETVLAQSLSQRRDKRVSTKPQDETKTRQTSLVSDRLETVSRDTGNKPFARPCTKSREGGELL
ncbi:hypothetical protein PROFUN_16162 [Planoprotostelium fungivorum]|uniref:JmjC domain-containing protein n=1 Tax=Planoprotostelium fungivorum TaxID=1890364 RepID=A0A2P6MS95_9EUKA|nr:hypothetical protein PROFUN_16162 [Planoprotostelium fungivorum]